MNQRQQWLILLAEDEPANVLLIRRAISKVQDNIQLEVVGNGEQAVSYLSGDGEYSDRQRYPLPNLVLTNIKMPRMNGMELLGSRSRNPS